MTQADRDRLVTLKKAKKKLITQREAAEELGLSIRQVKRLLYGVEEARRQGRGPRAAREAVEPADRRERSRRQAVKILSAPVYQGFGPTLAAEYLAQEARDRGEQGDGAAVDDPRASCGGRKERRSKQVHVWRPRRSRFGELVQWDTSDARLAGRARGEAVPDRDDRRRDQPVVRALRAARFDRREHEAGVELRGEVRSAAGVLYGQGEPVSDGGEAQAG